MASSSETGHDINLANFRTLITACTYFGVPYNPGNVALKLPALNTTASAAQTALNDIGNARPVLKIKMGEREAAFEAMTLLLTRIVGAHATLSTNAALKAEVKTLVRRIRGKRASTPPTPTTDEPTPEQISAAQTSYENRAARFADLVRTLQADPQYLPNEDDLKVVALQAFADELAATNAAVRNADAPMENALAARNTIFYTGPNNLVDTALLVKQYVKSLYGVKSDQYRQISGLKFTRPKKRT